MNTVTDRTNEVIKCFTATRRHAPAISRILINNAIREYGLPAVEMVVLNGAYLTVPELTAARDFIGR